MKELNRLAVIAGIDFVEEARGISDDTWDGMSNSKQKKYIKEHPTSRFAKDPKYGYAKKVEVKKKKYTIKNPKLKSADSKSKSFTELHKRLKSIFESNDGPQIFEINKISPTWLRNKVNRLNKKERLIIDRLLDKNGQGSLKDLMDQIDYSEEVRQEHRKIKRGINK